MSAPSTVTEPEVGVSRPSKIDSVVVLPAPLPPSSAVVEPAWTAKLTPSTAVTVPKRLKRSSTTIACAEKITVIFRAVGPPGCFSPAVAVGSMFKLSRCRRTDLVRQTSGADSALTMIDGQNKRIGSGHLVAEPRSAYMVGGTRLGHGRPDLNPFVQQGVAEELLVPSPSTASHAGVFARAVSRRSSLVSRPTFWTFCALS